MGQILWWWIQDKWWNYYRNETWSSYNWSDKRHSYCEWRQAVFPCWPIWYIIWTSLSSVHTRGKVILLGRNLFLWLVYWKISFYTHFSYTWIVTFLCIVTFCSLYMWLNQIDHSFKMLIEKFGVIIWWTCMPCNELIDCVAMQPQYL